MSLGAKMHTEHPARDVKAEEGDGAEGQVGTQGAESWARKGSVERPRYVP